MGQSFRRPWSCRKDWTLLPRGGRVPPHLVEQRASHTAVRTAQSHQGEGTAPGLRAHCDLLLLHRGLSSCCPPSSPRGPVCSVHVLECSQRRRRPTLEYWWPALLLLKAVGRRVSAGVSAEASSEFPAFPQESWGSPQEAGAPQGVFRSA